MPGVLDGLEPALVWYWFEKLSAVPRASGDEDRAAGFLEAFSSGRGLPSRRDSVGNVLITKPGSGPSASKPPVALQAHVDMVAEKVTGSSHDFSRDPIRLEVEGDWVLARETTLGADNGLGVAFMLAILDDPSAVHPPLECLFTVDEERGLTGASRLEPSWLTARRLVNLDSENEGHFCIGCAGGLDIIVTLPMRRSVAPAGLEAVRISVNGLKGGHSGMEIGRGRANAVRIVARIVHRMLDRGCHLCSISGGTKRNAIPRSATAVMLASPASRSAISGLLADLEAQQRQEYALVDDRITISMEPAGPVEDVYDHSSASTLADMLLAFPHGVEKLSGVTPGLVETSLNLALLEETERGVSTILTLRSLRDDAKLNLAERVMAVGRLAEARIEAGGGYPGWSPDPSSRLLEAVRRLYREFSGSEAVIETVHAGVECGIIGSRMGGMDMISMGPDIRDVHIPGERASISSTARTWAFLRKLLENL